jgi:outer membrane protein X
MAIKKFMKKFYLVLLIGLMSVSSVFAQKGETTVGLNLGYGSEIKSIGIGAKVGYGITDQIRIAPSFNYFLEKDYLSQWEVNADLHYLFPLSDKVTVYPLAGVAYINWKVNFGDIFGDDDSSATTSKIGINLGGGIGYSLTEKISIGAELKYSVVSDFDQAVFAVNIAYKF